MCYFGFQNIGIGYSSVFYGQRLINGVSSDIYFNMPRLGLSNVCTLSLPFNDRVYTTLCDVEIYAYWAIVPVDVIVNVPSSNVDKVLKYDDYLETDAEYASGSLEILTSENGTTYVHAFSIGEGTYVDGSGLHKVTVQKADLDLIFIIGQSNACYVSSVMSDVSPLPCLGTAYFYTSHEDGRYDEIDVSKAVIKPMLDLNKKPLTANMAPSLCAKYYEETGHKVLFVCGAIGGVSIGGYQPHAYCWNYACDVVHGAVNAVDLYNYNLNICSSFGIIQGEADSQKTQQWYKTNFTTMFNEITERGFNGIKFENVIVSLTMEKYGMNPRSVQISLSKENPHVIIGADPNDFTEENGNLTPGDPIHYSQAGRNKIGADLGHVFAQMQCGDTSNDSTDSDHVNLVVCSIICVVILSVSIYVILGRCKK